MINVDDPTKQNIKEHNPDQPEIPDYPYRIFVAGGSGSGKSSRFLNVTNHKPDTNKSCLNAKHLYEAKYQSLINKRESAGLKYLNDSKTVIQYSKNWMIFIKVLSSNIDEVIR